jgi:hypothetical protein
MASILSSGQRSVSSALDSVAVTAETATQLISTASRAVDMLDIKAQAMHQDVKENAVISLAVNQETTINARASEVTLRKEELHRSMKFEGTFDRNAVYTATVALIKQALTDAAAKETIATE